MKRGTFSSHFEPKIKLLYDVTVLEQRATGEAFYSSTGDHEERPDHADSALTTRDEKAKGKTPELENPGR